MGQEIVYCVNCQKRLTTTDFQRGTAERVGGKIACSECAEGIRAFLGSEEPAAPPRQTGTTTKVRRETRPVAAAPSAGTRSTQIRTRTGQTGLRPRVGAPPPPPESEPPGEEAGAEAEDPGRRKKILILAGAGGGLVLLVGIVVVLLLARGKKDAPPEPEVAAAPAPEARLETPKPALTGHELLGSGRLEEARKFARENPDDLAGQIERFDKVVWEYDKTSAGEEAKKISGELKARLKERVEGQLSEIESEVAAPLSREEFKLVIDLLERARKRQETPAWGLAVDRKIREVRDKALGLFKSLVEKAGTLQGEASAGELRKIRDQIVRWGLEDYLADFDKLYPGAAAASPAAAEANPGEAAPKPAGPPAPPLPERTAEGKDYVDRWEKAMGRATAREYEAALAELTVATRSITEDELKKEALADAEDLRRVAAAFGEISNALAQWPRHAGLALDVYDGSSVKKIAGSVVESDPERVELKAATLRETAFVEYTEATSASLVEFLKARKDRKMPDARAMAIFCLLDGHWQGALGFLGGKIDKVHPKYWHYAKEARAKIRKGDSATLYAARTLYYAAERNYRTLATRFQAVEKYKTLLRDYGDASLVGRHAARLRARLESCRDYLILPRDMEGAGTFEVKKHPQNEAWTSTEDTDLRVANQNYVEFAFCALPETVYRCWILIGGCCTESFQYLYQTTDLSHKEGRETFRVEPGSDAALPGKPVTYNLKKLHEHHVKKDPKDPSKVPPKEPEKWVWVDFPLPKYAGPGLKKVRLLTAQQGFSVAQAVVSCTLKKAPADAELKELEKQREPGINAEGDPDLVGHWRFEEAGGGVAGDASGLGNAGLLEGKPSWPDGKVGKALAFKGDDDCVVVPDTPRLRLSGDLTLALWMKKSGEGSEWQRIVGKGDPTLRNYGIWEDGSSRKIMFQQYNHEGKEVISLKSKKDLDVGKWYHVAAVVKGSRVLLYINGAEDARGNRTQKAGTSEAPFTIGWGKMHAVFNGALDEVRLYSRALSTDEVKALYESGK